MILNIKIIIYIKIKRIIKEEIHLIKNKIINNEIFLYKDKFYIYYKLYKIINLCTK